MNAYKIYVNWKVKLLEKSDPQNLDEFLARYKITKEEVLAFQSLPNYEDDLRKASLSWLQSKIPELLHVAFKEAKESKSVADIERLVDIAHALKKKGEAQSNQFNFFNLDAKQHKRIAERYLNGGALSLPSGSGASQPN